MAASLQSRSLSGMLWDVFTDFFKWIDGNEYLFEGDCTCVT